MKKHAVVDLLIEFRKDNDLFNEFIADPVIFFEKHKLELTEAEKKYLLSVDKTTLYAYIQEGFDIRISKCLWTWYYMQFTGSSVIHAIPDCCFGGISVHQFMLSDMIRNLHFKNALEEIIDQNSIVADVGTGTGVLAIWASMAGAKKVYAIEKDRQIFKVASRLVEENKLNNIILINADAKKVILPEKVDIIVSECIGSFGINEPFIPTVSVFKEKNLKKGGIIIPSIIYLEVVPCETLFYDVWVDFSQQDLLGISLHCFDTHLKNQIFTVIGDQDEFLSSPQKLWQLNLDKYKGNTIKFNSSLKFNTIRDGIFHGFLGWFKAYLTSRVILDTSPTSPRTHWYQIFFPIQHPIEVRKGDVISAKFEAKINAKSIKWKWTVITKGCKMVHDTEKSFPTKSFLSSKG